MENLNENQLLKYAIENGIIDIDTIQRQIAMNERKKYLEMHKARVWQGSDGKYRTYLTSGEKRKLVCKKDREELENSIVEHYKQASDEPTLRMVFYLWMEKKLEYGEVQKQTLDRYEVDLKRFFKDSKLLDIKIKYITENDLEDFIRVTIHQQGLSAKAWGNLRTLLNGIFKFAKKRGYTNLMITNFMSELDLSKKIFNNKIKGEFDNVFTENELDKLVKYLQSIPKIQHLGVLLAIHTGMRVGEIIALKWEDIYDDYIYVHRTQIRYKGNDGKVVYEIRDCPKTEAGVRKVVISKSAKAILKQIRMLSFGNEYLFAKNGNVKTVHCLGMALYRACEKIGIPKRSMHVLRKTYATRLINAGVDEAIIINQMGHTEFATTKAYYYYNDKLTSQVAEKIQQAINF